MASPCHQLSLLCLLLFCTLRAHTAIEIKQLTRSYRTGPINLTDHAQFFYQFEPSFNRIFLGLVVNDSAVVSADNNWVGIGIGEPMSGSMLGSDIVTAHFTPGMFETCRIVDRYIPFVASPISDSPSVFPLPDECETSDWLLISCTRDAKAGLMTLEVRRPLTVEDDRQDRPIPAGINSVLHAYGAEFGYHNEKRHATRIKLFSFNREESSYSLKGLPSDVSGHLEVRATTYEVPSANTRACTAVRVPLEENEKVMIVAAEPVINDDIVWMIRQIVLLVCSGEDYASQMAETVLCENSPPGPFGNTRANCSSFVYAYTRGLKGFEYPSIGGVLVSNENPYLVMETFYTNPSSKLQFDTSGIRVHYTKRLRRFSIGSLFLGDPLLSRSGQKIIDGQRYQHSCPKSCTSRFKRAINVFNTFPYMGSFGQSIRTNMFRANGRFVQRVSEIDFWTEGFQRSKHFEPVLKIRNGDQLQTTCKYNVSKAPGTIFGLGSGSETCIEILLYWPLQVDRATGGNIEICGFKASKSNKDPNLGTTLCGNSFQIADIPAKEVNPVLDDTYESKSVFGQLSEQCSAPETPTPTTSEGASESGKGIGMSSDDGETAMATAENESENESEATSTSAEGSTEPGSEVSTGTENADEEDDDASAQSGSSGTECFSGEATVQLRNGRTRRMNELTVGDEVLVSDGAFSPVFMFSHAEADAITRFIRLHFDDEGLSMAVTFGHVVPIVNRGMKKARDVAVGDIMFGGDGRQITVTSIMTELGAGLYNPQTIDGNIVVDGVLATTFTDAVEPVTATALLAPLRWVFTMIWAETSRILV